MASPHAIVVSEIPARGCGGKRVYESFLLAAKMAKRTRRQKECKVEAYSCRVCHRFHVGEL